MARYTVRNDLNMREAVVEKIINSTDFVEFTAEELATALFMFRAVRLSWKKSNDAAASRRELQEKITKLSKTDPELRAMYEKRGIKL